MGMFDYVNYKAPCKKCGEEITEFQSKDAGCNLERIEPREVDHFYGDCPVCETWHDYEVEREDTKIRLVDKEE